MSVPDRLLRQVLAGAADPPDRARVERALRDTPALYARMLALQAELPPEPPLGWVLPPPGAGSGLQAAPAPVMDGAAEGWLVLTLAADSALADHRVVVLERAGAAWAVGAPQSPEEAVTVAALPRTGDEVRLDYAPAAQAERIAVVLVPPEVPIRWDTPGDERWAEVQDAVLAGALPAVVVRRP